MDGSRESTPKTHPADESQNDTVMDDSQTGTVTEGDTQPLDEATQVDGTQQGDSMDADEDPIEWPESPEPRRRKLEMSMN